jgi:hypothetical protein
MSEIGFNFGDAPFEVGADGIDIVIAGVTALEPESEASISIYREIPDEENEGETVSIIVGHWKDTIAFGDVGSEFVAVANIDTNIPNTITAGTSLTLTGTVTPTNATNQTIVWSVTSAGGTGASISGNTLSATAAGTVVVTATVVNGAGVSADYTQDFPITVNPVPVTLTGISVSSAPYKTVYTVGETLDLAGLIVAASYSIGSPKAVTGYSTNPADGAVLNNAGTVAVVISYTEGGLTETAGFDITVKEADPEPPADPILEIAGYTTPERVKAGLTAYDYIYRVRVKNTGGAAENVTATLVNYAQYSGIFTVIGSNVLNFGDVQSDAVKESQDTLTIRIPVNKSASFNESMLEFRIDY